MMTFGQQDAPCSACQAPATIIEGDGFGPDRLVCDVHSRFRNPAAALPYGYHARTLGFPMAAPYTSTVYPGTGTNPALPGVGPGVGPGGEMVQA